jgi:hypothetical protein
VSAIQTSVLRALRESFPPRVVQGVITPHECDECAAIRRVLEGHSWHEISNDFAETFSGSLPLLSPDAYNAYLPIWLTAAIEHPDGEAAAMVPINLADKPSKIGFTPSQCAALIAVVEFVAANNWCGPDDPVNIKHVSAVRAEWGGSVA